MKSVAKNIKYKILVLSHISELVGGAEKSLLDVFDLWRKEHDIEVEFILRKPVGTLATALKERQWKYHELDYTFWSVGNPATANEEIFRHAIKNTKAIKGIEKIIESYKPDLVLTNSIVCPWAAVAAYYQNVPHVWFVREYGDLDHGRIFELGREKTLQDVDTMSDLVASNSQALATHLSGYIDKNKLQVVYNPFNINSLIELSKAKVANPFKNQNSLKIVATGTLTTSKGQLEIVKAVAKLNTEGKDVELCLVGGNGPKDYRQEIEQIITDNKLENKIHLVGHQKNPLTFVALADLGVTASRMEAFGRVTFEYMALGKAVIGTNTGGTPEMIDEGNNGFLYEPKNIEELSNKIEKYFDDKNLITKHGEKSKEIAKSMMTGDYSAENLFNIIESIVNSKSLNKTKQPLNYTHRLLDYMQIADDYLNETGKVSVKKLAKQRVKARARTGYNLARITARKILKK